MIIADILTVAFLISVYAVYFAGIFLILFSLQIFIQKLLVWYGEVVSVLLVVLIVLAFQRNLNLRAITDVLFQQ